MPIPALVLEWLELKRQNAVEINRDCNKRIQERGLTAAGDILIEEWKTQRMTSSVEASVLYDVLEKLKGLDS